MKNLIIIASLVAFSSTAYAGPKDEDKKFVSQAMKMSEPSTGSLNTPKKSTEEPKERPNENLKETKNTEVDSSYYSVNKFNFLFYLMYKLKYTEENPLEQKKETIRVE